MSPVMLLSLWVGPASAQEAEEAPVAESSEVEAPSEALPEAPSEALPVAPELPAVPEPVAPVPEPPVAAVPVAAPEVASAAPVEDDPEQPVPPPMELPPRLLRFAVSLEAGTLTNHDPSYDLFANGDVMGSLGLSAGLRLTRNLSVVGSWHRVSRGADVRVRLPDEDADFESRDQHLRAALVAHQLAAGARLDFAVAEHLRPYVAGQGMAVPTRVRLDDDPEVRDNPGQVEALGIATGALLLFGAELRAPVSEALQPAVYLEMGPSWLTRAELGELGSMRMGGFALRTGFGLRF